MCAARLHVGRKLSGRNTILANSVPVRSGLIIGVRSWLAARDAVAQLAATVASQKQILAQVATREDQRDAAVAKTVASIKQASTAVKTPAEAAEQIPMVLPSLPAPLNLDLPAPDASDATPPATATVPQADLQPIYGYIQECRVCEAERSAAQADLSDERTKEAALTTERDAAIKEAHGGSFWSRVRSSAKWLILGAAAGALAAEAAHH